MKTNVFEIVTMVGEDDGMSRLTRTIICDDIFTASYYAKEIVATLKENGHHDVEVVSIEKVDVIANKNKIDFNDRWEKVEGKVKNLNYPIDNTNDM